MLLHDKSQQAGAIFRGIMNRAQPNHLLQRTRRKRRVAERER